MSLFEKCFEYSKNQTPFVLVTIVEARGSVPQEAGAKMMVDARGLVMGTIGGGEVEKKAIDRAVDFISRDAATKSDFVTWNLQKDFAMNCGGEVKLYFEVHKEARWHIQIFGAGHVAQALVPLLLTLDCRVTCTDSRQEWLDQLPKNDRLKTLCLNEEDFKNALSEDRTDNEWFVVMTRDHSLDTQVAEAILRLGTPAYLGIIGSRLKAQKLRDSLQQSGISPINIEKISCPIGLSFGKNTPPEISISVVAQILMIRDLPAKPGTSEN